MIIEIALGIVLAVIILWCLPLILAGGVVLIGLAIAAGLLALLIFYWAKALWILAIGLILLVSIGVPTLLYHRLMRVPFIAAAAGGAAPYNSLRALPLRIAVTGALAVGLVSLGIGIAMTAGAMFDHYERSAVSNRQSPSSSSIRFSTFAG